MKRLTRTLAGLLCVATCMGSLAGCQFQPAGDPTQPPTEPVVNISENYETRVDFGAKFEPKGNYILHIGGQDTKGFNGYLEVTGKELAPTGTMTYISVHNDYQNSYNHLKSLTENYNDYGYLSYQIGVHFNEDENPFATFYHELADGLKDKEFKELINIFKSLNRPVYCRPGFEFNGQWNGYTEPEVYKRAFIRFAELVEECEADNIALLWCYNPDAKERDYMQYYPGDEYVDWWAIDIFRVGSMDMPNAKAFLEEAEFHEKPVMITEATPTGNNVSKGEGWEEWFVPFFQFIRENPVIKGVCYINWNWQEYEKWKDWGNARLDQAPVELVAKYREELSDCIYLHAQDKNSAIASLYDCRDYENP